MKNTEWDPCVRAVLAVMKMKPSHQIQYVLPSLYFNSFGLPGRAGFIASINLQEVRRQQQLEAAEKRIQSQENRGIKNPEKVMRMQKKADEKERLQEQAATRYDGGGGGLRVSR